MAAPIRDQTKRFYAFGPFRLDPEKRVLVREGTPVPLTPKAAEALLMLVENAGLLVDKNDLMGRIWPDAVVEEGNLNKNIFFLRKTLGKWDDREYIETVAKRGFRFVAPVGEVTHAEVALRPAGPAGASLIGKKVSHYRVLALIGGGGMGLVYAAEDLKLGRPVALKFLPEDLATDSVALQRFEREARTASAVSHPNICTVYEFGEHEGQPFIVMELLEGQTLRQHISKVAAAEGAELPLEELLDISIQVARGLEAAHQKEIIHRDIKPANIFVTALRQVKILDFGLARLAASTSQGATALLCEDDTRDTEIRTKRGLTIDHSLTRLGTRMGTAGYMSPEQVRGEKLDARTDLFSFGLVLYEMATGQRAFGGDTAAIVHDAILNQAPVPIQKLNSSIPLKLEYIVGRALEKDREQRYQSAADMLADLEEIRSGDTRRAARTSKWFALPVLLLASIAGGVLYLHSRNIFKLTMNDTVILADLGNQTGDPVLDDALNPALRVELEQTPFLSVLARDKVRRTLRLLNRSEDSQLSPETAREVCLRTGSKAVVASSIADIGNRFRISLQGIDCQTGKIFAQVQQEATDRSSVIHALGLAGANLRSKLGEPGPLLQRFNKPLDEATTPSLEALQSYTVGVRRSAELGSVEALPYLKTAVELDPKFSRAYAKLGNESPNGDVATKYYEKAYELKERLSERDRLYVEGHYYTNAIGELEKATQTWLEWIRTYPNDYEPYVNLGSVYAVEGQYEKAATVTREALRLLPQHSAAASNLMAYYIAMNRFDEATNTLQDLRARKLFGAGAHYCAYLLAFLESDTAAMRERSNEGLSLRGDQSSMLSIQSDTEAYYGSFRTARALSQRAAESATRAGAEELAARWRAQQALREAEIGNSAVARKGAMDALAISGGREVEPSAALAFARAGDPASAQTLVEKLDREYPRDTIMQHYWLPTIRAAIELKNGDAQRAIATLVPARDYELGLPYGFGTFGNLYPAYVRGLAHLQRGQAQQAATEFQKMIDHPGIVLNSVTGALAHLQLGRVQVMMGDKVAAHKSYLRFLTLWKDADPDIPIYKQAKAEYAKLK